MELAVLERLESVERDRLAKRSMGAMLFVEQQAVASQPGGLREHGLRRDFITTGDLSESGAGDETMEDLG